MKSAKKNNLKPKADIMVNVSTLKAHLSEYLRKIKEGVGVIVLDRQLPVAKLVAFSGDESSLIKSVPTISMKEVIHQLNENDKKKKASKLKKDSLFYLNEDRGS